MKTLLIILTLLPFSALANKPIMSGEQAPLTVTQALEVSLTHAATLEASAMADANATNINNIDIDNSGGDSFSKSNSSSSVGDINTTNEGAKVEQNVNTPRQPSKLVIKNTPSMPAPGLASSHSCALGKSAGLAIPGLGASGGKQVVDPACVRRELIRIAFGSGLINRGAYMWCEDAVAAGSTFEDPEDPFSACLAFEIAQKVEQIVVHVRVEDGQKKCDLRAVGQTVIKEYTDDGIQVVYECQQLAKGS